MRNARLDELQAGIKTGKRNINNLRYTDDTPLMAESEEELKSLFMVQLSQLYMITGKTIALTIRIFVGGVMSLLFNTV